MTAVGIGSRRGHLLPATLMADPNTVPTLVGSFGLHDPSFYLSHHSNSRGTPAQDAGPTHKNYERPPHLFPQSGDRRRSIEEGPLDYPSRSATNESVAGVSLIITSVIFALGLPLSVFS